MSLPAAYSLGPYRIEPSECAIYPHGSEKISLQPKFIEVLNYLALHYPKVVSREELIEVVWSGNEYVGEKALTNAVWHLRQALKSHDNTEDMIETIRKTGYRLCVKPTLLNEEQPVIAVPEASRKPFHIAILVAGSALLALLVFVWWWQQFLHVSPNRPENITTEPGLELFPAPSPDGSMLVYKWSGPSGFKDLFLLDLSAAEQSAVNLTGDQANEGRAVWSRDGRYLYFRRQDREAELCRLVQLDMSHNTEKLLGFCPYSRDLHYLDISPDDQTLAYLGVDEKYRNAGIYLVNPHEAIPKPQLFSCLKKECHYQDQDMAYSPDGRYLAVTRRESAFLENVFLVDLSSGQSRQLTFDEEDIVGMSWHPSGKELIYAVQRADSRSGFRIDIVTADSRPLELDGFSYPAFVRTKNDLFYQYRKEQYQITSLHIGQQLDSSLYSGLQSDFNFKYPDYSPAQDNLAFVSNESGHQEVWISDTNGHHRRQLTQLRRTIKFPSWSHDGSQIAFLAANDDKRSDSIYTVNVQSGKVSRIVTPFTRHNRPSWSMDDQSIFTSVVANKHHDIYEFRLDGSKIQRVTFNGGRYAKALQDDSLLYSDAEGGLWMLEAGAEGPLPVLSNAQFSTRYSWTSYAGKVYFMRGDEQYQNITEFEFASQQQRLLMRIPRASVAEGTALSLDSKRQRLLLTNTLFYQSDIKIVRDFK